MKKHIRYHPAENGGEPRIYAIPRRQTTFRVELYARTERGETKSTIRIVDKMTIHDAHAVAIEALCEIVRDGEPVEDAWFEVWA